MAAAQLGLGNPTNLFHCPIEGGDREFERVAPGRLGHLLSKVDPERFDDPALVRCQGCSTSFDNAVLEVITNHEMAKRTDVAARSLFGSLIRATPGDQQIRAAALDAMIPYLIRPGSAADLVDLDDIAEGEDPLRQLGDVLHKSALLGMMESAIQVAVAGGRIRARHLSILVHAGEALGVSQRWIRSRIVEQRRSA